MKTEMPPSFLNTTLDLHGVKDRSKQRPEHTFCRSSDSGKSQGTIIVKRTNTSRFLLPIFPGNISNSIMRIFVQHQGQQTGPFSQQEIKQGLANGHYQPSDLAWYEGIETWIPLSSLPTHQVDNPVMSSATESAKSGLAITSMVLGISAFLCGVTAIPAVICGHIALGKIKKSHGAISGRGFAIAGLVTGYIGLVVFVIAFLAGLTAPIVIRQRKKADQTEAISNARQFGLALYEFKSEYGGFPDASTASTVASQTGTPELTGSSSNARLRQLIHADITQSEQIFYAKTSATQRPDGDISGDRAIAPGECGFGYVENIRTDDNTPRPVAMAPFKPNSRQFDPSPFDGKAVILWSDSSVTSMPIERTTGEVILDGEDLLSPTHPVWGGTPPSLLLPE